MYNQWYDISFATLYDAENCPVHAWKECMMAAHNGVDNKVYRVHHKAAFCVFWLLVVSPFYLIKIPLIRYICISPRCLGVALIFTWLPVFQPFVLANNGTWNPHQVELALWTHYVASEMKPELLNTIPNPTENGTSHHDQKNGDSTPKPQVLQHS